MSVDVNQSGLPEKSEPIELKIGPWSQLQGDSAWVRSQVFIDEQGIDASDEWDAADADAVHCVAYRQRQAIATGRILADATIGRMAVLREHRRQGVAGRVLQALMHEGFKRGESRFELSSQSTACDLYAKYGFGIVSDPYLEVGIEHRQMRFESQLIETKVACGDGAELYQVDWRVTIPAVIRGNPSASNRLARPPRSNRGIYLLHGLGEHCRRYDAVARWLNSLGWQVRSHDHRGHGRSSGKRGVLANPRDFVVDAARQISRFAAELGTTPLLLGHSMGGALAAELVLTEGLVVRGLMLSSPALGIGMSGFQKRLLSGLNALAPTLAVGNGIDAQFISHDPAVVAAYRDDPLVHNKVSARLVTWLRNSGEQSRERAAALKVPTLLMVAGADRLVDPAASREFADRAGLSVLTTRWYEPAFHELFNEATAQRLRVLTDLGDWLNHHFSAPPLTS